MQKIIMGTTQGLPSSVLAKRFRNKIHIDFAATDSLQFKIAEQTQEFEDACRLVHDQYVNKGYMEKRKSGMRLSLFHALPETTTFIGKKADQVVHTLTLFQDSALGLPMDSIYKRELDLLRAQGRRIAEVGALAAHPDVQYADQTALMIGNKIMMTYGRDHLDLDDLVIAINPKHQWLYEYVLLLEKIGELKQYDYVKKAPAVAYRLDLRTVEEKFRLTYSAQPPEKDLHRFFFKERSQCIDLPADKEAFCFWNREKIRYFFKEKTTLYYKADRKSRECLQREYSLRAGMESRVKDFPFDLPSYKKKQVPFYPGGETPCFLPARVA